MARSTRNGLVDYGRGLAAVGVVWYHADAPGMLVAYSGLPFFLCLLALPSSASLAGRAQRLLLPFLQWSAVYAMAKIALATLNDAPVLDWWHWYMLVAGTQFHLWFLPFAFVVAVFAPLLRTRFLAPAAAVAATAAICLVGSPASPPWAQWSFGLIPVLVGFTYFASGWRVALPVLLLCSGALFIWHPSVDNTALLVGSALAIAALTFRLAPTPVSDWCNRVSMPVYLAHPLLLTAGRLIDLSGVPLVLFAVVGSIGLAEGVGLARHLLLRRRPASATAIG